MFSAVFIVPNTPLTQVHTGASTSLQLEAGLNLHVQYIKINDMPRFHNERLNVCILSSL